MKDLGRGPDRLGKCPALPHHPQAPGQEPVTRPFMPGTRDHGSAHRRASFYTGALKELEEKGIDIAYVTLHVGLGTFRPVKVENLQEHHMHSEYYQVTREAADKINRAKAAGHRVVCVETTSRRTVESACDENGLYRNAVIIRRFSSIRDTGSRCWMR